MDFFDMAAENLFLSTAQIECGSSSVLCEDSKGKFEIFLDRREEGLFLSINRGGNDFNELEILDVPDAISVMKRWKMAGLIGKKQFMLGLGFDSAKMEIKKIKDKLGLTEREEPLAS